MSSTTRTHCFLGILKIWWIFRNDQEKAKGYMGAIGVDLNASMTKFVINLSLFIKVEDAHEFARNQMVQSGAISAFHRVGHVPIACLIDLLDECHQVTELLVLETPREICRRHLVFLNKPLPPPLLQFSCTEFSCGRYSDRAVAGAESELKQAVCGLEAQREAELAELNGPFRNAKTQGLQPFEHLQRQRESESPILTLSLSEEKEAEREFLPRENELYAQLTFMQRYIEAARASTSWRVAVALRYASRSGRWLARGSIACG
jgi:hypothetical protein